MILSLSESGKIFAPNTLGRVVRNLGPDDQGVLKTAGHLSPYDPKATGFPSTGTYHGHGFSSSLAGAREMLCVRIGGTIYTHRGWTGTWSSLATGIVDDPAQTTPDLFLPTKDGGMIWSNGRTAPLILDPNGRVTHPLGFDQRPAAPVPHSPTQGRQTQMFGAKPALQPPNHYGYALQGNIGSLSSDGAGEDGTLLAGSWTYYIQLEDKYGSRSPLSPASAPATLEVASSGYVTPYNTDYVRKNRVDALRRSFAVGLSGPHASNTKAILLYRTPNTVVNLSGDTLEPRLVARIENNSGFWFDNLSDSRLLMEDPAVEYAPVRAFRAGTIAGDRLICGGFPEAPRTIRWSEQSFYGSWRVSASLDLPEDVTCIAAHQGEILAFTRSKCYSLTLTDEAGTASYIGAAGCAGPSSIIQADDGSIIWLSGQIGKAFRRDASGIIKDESLAIQEELSRIPPMQVSRCQATWDPKKGQAILPLLGYVPCWNVGQGWTRYILDVQVAGLSPGPRDCCIAAAQDEGVWGIYAWDRYTPVATLDNPEAYWESVEIVLDPSSPKQLCLKNIYLHCIESDAGDGRVSATSGWASLSIYKGRRGQYQAQPAVQNVDSGLYGRLLDPGFPKTGIYPMGIKYAPLGSTTTPWQWHGPSQVTLQFPAGASTLDRFYISVQSKSPLRITGISFELVASANATPKGMPHL